MGVEKTGGRPFWQRAIVVLFCGWIAIWIARMMFTPIYSVLSDFFGGVSNTQLGAISSFYFLGYVLMQIPSGLLVDRLGMRRVAMPGFVVFAAGTVVISLATTLPVLYAGSVVAGAGCGTFYGIAYSITNTYVPGDKRSVATAIVNSGTAVGSGAGLVGASYLVGQVGLPWQTLSGVTAVLAAAMAVVVWRVLPGLGGLSGDAGAGAKPVARGKVPLKRLFEPHMVASYILYFSTLYLYYLISTWLPNFLETERGFDGSIVGAVSSLVFFMGIPGALVFSRLADKRPHDQIKLIVALEAAATVSLIVAVSTGSVAVTVGGIVAYGFFGKLAVEPLIISLLGRYAPPEGVATTFGLFNFFGMSASVVAPSVTGIISDATGSGVGGYYLAAAVIVVGTMAFIVVNKVCDKRSSTQA